MCICVREATGAKLLPSQPPHTWRQVKQLRAAAAGQAPAESRQEAAAKGVIGKISKERNQEMERQGAELAAARGELEALRLKYDGAISRRKILEVCAWWRGWGWVREDRTSSAGCFGVVGVGKGAVEVELWKCRKVVRLDLG